MDAVTHLAPTVGVVAACDFLGVARASFYRQRPVLGPPASPAPEPALPAARPAPARALSPIERASVLTRLARRAISGPLSRRRSGHPAGRRPVPLLDPHHVPHPRRGGRVPRAPRSARSSGLPKTRVAGHRPQPTVELGHHQAAGSGQVDLLLSLRHPRRLQPLRRRLDGRAPGRRGTGQAIYRGDHRQAPGSRRPAHHPRRPRQGHDFQAGRLSDGRPRRHQDPQPALCFRRQPVFGKPVPHHEVPPGVPGSLRLHPRQPRLLSAVFPVVQPRASPLRHRLADPGHGSLSARPRLSWPTARWCSTPLTKRTRTASFGDRQNHCHCHRRFGSTGRFHPAKRQRKNASSRGSPSRNASEWSGDWCAAGGAACP